MLVSVQPVTKREPAGSRDRADIDLPPPGRGSDGVATADAEDVNGAVRVTGRPCPLEMAGVDLLLLPEFAAAGFAEAAAALTPLSASPFASSAGAMYLLYAGFSSRLSIMAAISASLLSLPDNPSNASGLAISSASSVLAVSLNSLLSTGAVSEASPMSSGTGDEFEVAGRRTVNSRSLTLPKTRTSPSFSNTVAFLGILCPFTCVPCLPPRSCSITLCSRELPIFARSSLPRRYQIIFGSTARHDV
mmetsp:Transcript_7015/g.14713  ORF Transcript_7015/g.14713 Transcript_7015/m.14713 type:complete len:247 (-) Transcript_7015:328-1068(-)